MYTNYFQLTPSEDAAWMWWCQYALWWVRYWNHLPIHSKVDKDSAPYVHRVDIIQSLKGDFTFASVFKDLEDITQNETWLRERHTPENYTFNLKYSQ